MEIRLLNKSLENWITEIIWSSKINESSNYEGFGSTNLNVR